MVVFRPISRGDIFCYSCLLLRRDGLFLARQCRMQRVPSKGCALDPHRKLGDAGKNGQLAQFSPVPVRRRLARHQLVELVENSFRFHGGLTLHALRHQGRRGLGYGASRTLEADVANRVALQVQVNGKMVTAERVISLRPVVRRRQLAIVARRFVVLQDDFLVELAQIGHQANTSRTFWMPSTKASTSSLVL